MADELQAEYLAIQIEMREQKKTTDAKIHYFLNFDADKAKADAEAKVIKDKARAKARDKARETIAKDLARGDERYSNAIYRYLSTEDIEIIKDIEKNLKKD